MTGKHLTKRNLVVLPAPGNACLSINGAEVFTPTGDRLADVCEVQISAKASECVEVTIKCLARVETAKDNSEPS